MAYRCQAAARHSLDWAIVDTALYSEAFTGRAKMMPHCIYCVEGTHDSKHCTYAPDEPTTLPQVPKPQSTTGPTGQK